MWRSAGVVAARVQQTDVGVAAEKGMEGGRLVPAHKQLLSRVAEKATRVSCVRHAETRGLVLGYRVGGAVLARRRS